MSKRFAALALGLMFLGASIGPALIGTAWAIVTCTVTNTFGSQSGTIPVSQIDTNFTDVKNCVNLAAAFTDLPLTRAYTGTQRFAKGANLTAAATLTLGSDGNYFTVTGNTGITAISSLEAGTVIWLTFTGTPVLTYNATNLILLGATNYTAANGDVMEFISEGGGNWREVWRRPVTSASSTTFFRGDGTWASVSGTGFTFAGKSTTEGTTTSAVVSDLVTVSSLSITQTTPFYVQFSFRKSAGAAATCQVGLKLNATALGTQGVTTGANAVEAGSGHWYVQPRSTNYLRPGGWASSSSNNLAAISAPTADAPTATITTVIIQGASTSALVTCGFTDVFVYSLATS